ncbi:MFS transporter [Kitasatospora sp. NPDC057692]|uniref:MFS transporter n=1 Tax=Kitasatospora sp. NPDC057692 TaxID=3346215 RepID=UPI003696D46B
MIWLLAVYGAGLVAGNGLAGRAADRALVPTAAALFAALALALALFTVTVHHRGAAVATLFLLGFCGFGLLAPTQAYVLRIAGRGSALVGTANTAAFGVGITLGSLLGAAVLEHGGPHPESSLPLTNLAGAAMTALGLLVFALSAAIGSGRRTLRKPTAGRDDQGEYAPAVTEPERGFRGGRA